MEKAVWETSYTDIAGLDPALEGGDKCVLRFGKYGKDTNGINVLELGDSIVIKVDLHCKEPIHYQIARQVYQICEARGVSPIPLWHGHHRRRRWSGFNF